MARVKPSTTMTGMLLRLLNQLSTLVNPHLKVGIPIPYEILPHDALGDEDWRSCLQYPALVADPNDKVDVPLWTNRLANLQEVVKMDGNHIDVQMDVNVWVAAVMSLTVSV
jgi:hypothetical protein